MKAEDKITLAEYKKQWVEDVVSELRRPRDPVVAETLRQKCAFGRIYNEVRERELHSTQEYAEMLAAASEEAWLLVKAAPR
jgi:hypothetical protein